MSKDLLHSVTIPWHSPLCSLCRQPIDDIGNARAVWFEVKLPVGHRAHSPMVLHNVECHGRVDSNAMSLAIDALRRAPMEAIIIALKHNAIDEDQRIVWHSWVSVVLGLPFGDGSAPWSGEVGEYLPDHVFTLEEARKA